MDFTQLKVDPIEGSEIMSLIGANVTQLSNPQLFQKIRDIIGFFQGKADKQFVISKLTLGKNVNKIDFLAEYVGLRRMHEAKLREMEALKTPDDLINSVPDEKARENLRSILGTSDLPQLKANELKQIEEQIMLYEK